MKQPNAKVIITTTTTSKATDIFFSAYYVPSIAICDLPALSFYTHKNSIG